MPPRTPLATPEQVACYLHKSEKTLANWRSLGMGPPYTKTEGGVLYVWRDVEKWLASKIVHPSVTSRTA